MTLLGILAIVALGFRLTALEHGPNEARAQLAGLLIAITIAAVVIGGLYLLTY